MASLITFIVLVAFSLSTGQCHANHSRVLILGAGAAGVSAADTLIKHGVTNFTILEARDYVGGRIRKSKLGSSTIELGANWIHGIGPENMMWQLKLRFGLTTDADDYYNTTVRDETGAVHAGGMSDYRKLSQEVEKVMKESYEAEEEIKADVPLRTSLLQGNVINRTPVQNALEYFLVDYENALPAEQLTARQVALTGGEGTDHFVNDQRGYSYTLQELSRNFTDRIHLNTTVTKIHHSDEHGVTVETKDGANFTADHVLVTFPTGVLARRELFVPDLPQWKYDAIYMLPMGYYTKIFIRFPSNFWDSSNYALLSNVRRGHFVVWMNLDKPAFFPGEHILLATVTGSESQRVERMSDSQVQVEIMAVLRNAHGVGIPSPTDFKMSRWSLDTGSYGVYAAPAIGIDALVFEHMRQPINKTVWFAGEAYEDELYGFAHGALHSGESRAAAMLKCINNNDCPKLRQRNATCPNAQPVPGGGMKICARRFAVEVIAMLASVALVLSVA